LSYFLKSISDVKFYPLEKDESHVENKFYTGTKKSVRVSKKEFDEFCKNYPRKLSVDVCAISDPPSISFNDFELANRWPYSVVANTWAYDEIPGEYFYEPEEERSYFITINYEELYNNKTGYFEE